MCFSCCRAGCVCHQVNSNILAFIKPCIYNYENITKLSKLTLLRMYFSGEDGCLVALGYCSAGWFSFTAKIY